MPSPVLLAVLPILVRLVVVLPRLHRLVLHLHRLLAQKAGHLGPVQLLRSYGLTARPGPLGWLGVPMITCCQLGDNNVTL